MKMDNPTEHQIFDFLRQHGYWGYGPERTKDIEPSVVLDAALACMQGLDQLVEDYQVDLVSNQHGRGPARI